MQKPATLLITKEVSDPSFRELKLLSDVLVLEPDNKELENIVINQFQIVILDRHLEKSVLIPFLKLVNSAQKLLSVPFVCFYGAPEGSIHSSWIPKNHSCIRLQETLELYSIWLNKPENTSLESIRLGPIELDLSLQNLKLTDFELNEEVHLTPIEYKIIRELLLAPGSPVTRERLIEVAWPPEGTVVKPRTIDVHIASLRKKLGPYRNCIRSIQSTGYILSLDFQ